MEKSMQNDIQGDPSDKTQDGTTNGKQDETTPGPSGGTTHEPSGGTTSGPSGGTTSEPSGGTTQGPSGGATQGPSGGAKHPWIYAFTNPRRIKEPPDVDYWTLAIHRLILLTAVISLIVGSIAAYFAYKDYQKVQNNTQGILKNIQNELKGVPEISYPQDRENVRTTGEVGGRISDKHFGKFVNLLVTPEATGEEWIQDKSIIVPQNGIWRIMANYGDTGNFYVRIAITSKPMLSGRVDHFPDDAIISNSIMVTRKE